MKKTEQKDSGVEEWPLQFTGISDACIPMLQNHITMLLSLNSFMQLISHSLNTSAFPYVGTGGVTGRDSIEISNSAGGLAETGP